MDFKLPFFWLFTCSCYNSDLRHLRGITRSWATWSKSSLWQPNLNFKQPKWQLNSCPMISGWAISSIMQMKRVKHVLWDTRSAKCPYHHCHHWLKEILGVMGPKPSVSSPLVGHSVLYWLQNWLVTGLNTRITADCWLQRDRPRIYGQWGQPVHPGIPKGLYWRLSPSARTDKSWSSESFFFFFLQQ